MGGCSASSSKEASPQYTSSSCCMDRVEDGPEPVSLHQVAALLRTSSCYLHAVHTSWNAPRTRKRGWERFGRSDKAVLCGAPAVWLSGDQHLFSRSLETGSMVALTALTPSAAPTMQLSTHPARSSHAHPPSAHPRHCSSPSRSSTHDTIQTQQ